LFDKWRFAAILLAGLLALAVISGLANHFKHVSESAALTEYIEGALTRQNWKVVPHKKPAFSTPVGSEPIAELRGRATWRGRPTAPGGANVKGSVSESPHSESADARNESPRIASAETPTSSSPRPRCDLDELELSVDCWAQAATAGPHKVAGKLVASASLCDGPRCRDFPAQLAGDLEVAIAPPKDLRLERFAVVPRPLSQWRAGWSCGAGPAYGTKGFDVVAACIWGAQF